MFMKNWRKDVFTIPNMLSLFRLMLIPLYVRIYLRAEDPGDYFLAGGILTVSCLTDWVDGKIARRFHMVTQLGKILDPLADKATQFVLIICLSIRYPVLNNLLALFVIKELFQASVGLYHLRKGKILPGALPAGKVCTAVLFISFIILVLLPHPDDRLVFILTLVDYCFIIWSFCAYFLAYFGGSPRVQDLET